MYSLAAYGKMVADTIRSDSYAQALAHDIKPGDVVAEIGTGPGIFALIACRLGARRVYAFEPAGVIEVAREIAAANGFADRIEFIPKTSTESSWPERVNVLVSDVRGTLPFFAHGLSSIIDARDRFLSPSGRIIPRQDSVWLAGVQAADVYRGHLGCWAGQAIRSRHVGCAPAADQLCQRMLGHRRSALSRTRCLATLDYMTLKHTDLDATVSWTVDYTSQGHGIVLWFDSVLAEDIALTNRPGAPRLIYRQSFLPWPSPLDLCSGDTVTVTVGALQNQRPLERC